MVLYSNHYKEILSGSALPVNAMTEQQKLTFPMLLQQLDSLMLRDKQRFARRLHGVKKVKNPDAQQAIFQEMAKEIEQAAGKVVLREAARPAITYPENLPVSKKKQEILNAVRDHQVVIVAGRPARGKPHSCRKSVWSSAAG